MFLLLFSCIKLVLSKKNNKPCIKKKDLIAACRKNMSKISLKEVGAHSRKCYEVSRGIKYFLPFRYVTFAFA